jgi:ribosome-interacting GTPase 1
VRASLSRLLLQLQNVLTPPLSRSVHPAHSLTDLIDRIWDELDLVRIYTKKRGAHPDLSDPVCMRKGSTIEARYLHLQRYAILIICCAAI